MANFEQYIHFDEVDLLVQAALIHCQFEMIHPFKDGNGRIGRLLIPLFLYKIEQCIWKNYLRFLKKMIMQHGLNIFWRV